MHDSSIKAVRRCDNCHRPFGLNTRGLPRKWDWRIFYWRVFHNRNCKREWVAKRKAEKAREEAISSLFRQHHPP